jgi:hypothetical protein
MSQPPPEPLSPLRRRQVGWRFGMLWFFTNASITSMSFWTLLAVPASNVLENPIAFLLGIATLGAAQGAILSKYFRNGFNVIHWATYTFIGGFISMSISISFWMLNVSDPNPHLLASTLAFSLVIATLGIAQGAILSKYFRNGFNVIRWAIYTFIGMSIFIFILILPVINFRLLESFGEAYGLPSMLIPNLICISAGTGTTGFFQSSKLDKYSAYAWFWLLTNTLSGLIIAVIISFSGKATWVNDNYISIETENLVVNVTIGVIYALITCGAMILIVRRPQDPDVVYWRHQ